MPLLAQTELIECKIQISKEGVICFTQMAIEIISYGDILT